MEIKLEDLQVGDEILIPSNSHFKYLRVLQPIRESKKRYKRDPSIKVYRNVKVSTNRETIVHKETRWGNTYTWNVHTYHCTPEGHNYEFYINLNGRSLWLIKRK